MQGREERIAMTDTSTASIRVGCGSSPTAVPSSTPRPNLSSAFNKASILSLVTNDSYSPVSLGCSLKMQKLALVPRATPGTF